MLKNTFVSPVYIRFPKHIPEKEWLYTSVLGDALPEKWHMQNGMMRSELVNTKHQSYLKEKAIISIAGNLIQLQ